MPKETGHMLNEADVGSGEKGEGEQETERQIRQVPQQDEKPQQESARSEPGTAEVPTDRRKNPDAQEKGANTGS